MSEKNKTKIKFTRNVYPILSKYRNLAIWKFAVSTIQNLIIQPVLVNGYKCISEQLVHKMYYM